MNKSQRLLSLDVFRGITIAGMILVNNPGSWDYVYPALQHAEWNGVTPTDLIFPFFLFIMGMAIPFALSKRIKEGVSKIEIIKKIISRVIILFILGLMINWFFNPALEFWKNIRIPGVLQRIAIVYLFTSLLFIYTKIRFHFIITFALLIGYWLAMVLIPVPGVGYANLEPTTNLSAWIDRLILSNHVWDYTAYWDPEGILSTIPAISSGIFGMITGQWMRSNKDEGRKTVWLFVFGGFAIVVSLFWDMWFPFNKNLWTSSYVVYTTGMALLFFGVCYWIIDIHKHNWWTKPFLVFGTNAITVFFLSEISAAVLYLVSVTYKGDSIELKEYIFQEFFNSWLPAIDASLVFALCYVLFWLGVMWILYSRRIFIKI